MYKRLKLDFYKMCKPNNYPKIVYKYRNWNEGFHKDILKKNHLFLASPKSFNDPLDCRISTNYITLNTNVKIQSFIDSVMRNHSDDLIESGVDISNTRKNLESRIKNNIINFQNEQEEILFDYQDKYYGVLSLCSKWDNTLMWSHYANMHKGFCVGFWEEKLRKYDLFSKDGVVKAGKVFYPTNDKFPHIDPFSTDLLDNAFKETHYKAKDWKYEDEYRLTKLFNHDKIDIIDEDRTIKIPDDFFAEIIIGLQTSDEVSEEIINIAMKKNIPVFRIVKEPFKFLLDRISIK